MLPNHGATHSFLDNESPIAIRRINTYVFRVPISQPVITSFGVMHDRPAVVVRVEDISGAVGWGEVWSNFPSCGAEHRARLVTTALAPHLLGQTFQNPADAYLYLERSLRTLTLQSGEWGPLAQAIAGVDIALWDLVTRRSGKGLAKALGGNTTTVPTYASGINLKEANKTIERCRDQGFNAFKIKVGFGSSQDLAVVREVAVDLKPGEQLMFDANQAWDLDTAIEMTNSLAEFNPGWVEEPMAVDRPIHEWRSLTDETKVPIAGGENIRSLQAFDALIQSNAFRVLQPDVCKWGGITGCVTVARRILEAGVRYCPHYLGGGIGLVTSSHLLAAVGGDGLLEVDSNYNPLREVLAMPTPRINDGLMEIPSAPGLGVEPDLSLASEWMVLSEEVRQ
ncbi:mandelate racemase/muconate lactonizing enzyme family protein [Halomonas sp. KAO]|nr:mandelate racemase/muconate lactonizing enzyme family protein [Halomonas sp. KAO]